MGAEKAADDFDKLGGLVLPAKRAAYSDRTAWLMSIMAELAYVEFDEDGDHNLRSLARDLADIGGELGLASLASDDNTPDAVRPKVTAVPQDAGDDVIADGTKNGNTQLALLLAQGGFVLKGVLFDEITDTQGFVATARGAGAPAMAIVAFRGTQPLQLKDWYTNLSATMIDITSRQAGSSECVGRVHAGFNRGYLSVKDQIREHLRGDEEIPLYITGHSLGGALATLAAWHLEGERLAACYTFGAPRVGDSMLRDRYRTPIYRIVNGTDPVPFVPPSKGTITSIRKVLRFISIFFGGSVLDFIIDKLIKIQGYLHYGDSRYLKICKPTRDQEYPTLSVEPNITPWGRIWRACRGGMEGAWSQGLRLDKYHDISIYRHKLRYWAIKRQRNKI